MLLSAGCTSNTAKVDNEMKVSRVFVEESVYIDSIEVYQNGTGGEVRTA